MLLLFNPNNQWPLSLMVELRTPNPPMGVRFPQGSIYFFEILLKY